MRASFLRALKLGDAGGDDRLVPVGCAGQEIERPADLFLFLAGRDIADRQRRRGDLAAGGVEGFEPVLISEMRGHSTASRRANPRSSNSRAIIAASIVLPTPTSSAIRSRTRDCRKP
jgi:hypothetical protein